MSLIARSNPFANKPTALKAAADILSRSTFYNLNEEQFIERVHFDISTFICQKSSGWTACFAHFSYFKPFSRNLN